MELPGSTHWNWPPDDQADTGEHIGMDAAKHMHMRRMSMDIIIVQVFFICGSPFLQTIPSR